jgi:hypothetical protein
MMRRVSVTRKVVDTNFLRNSELKSYLEESAQNYALLTDYNGIEAFKESTGKNIHESMEILSSYPDQVIILTNTIIACGIIPNKKAGLDWLIDSDQTTHFKSFCSSLQKFQNGELDMKEFINESRFEAQHQMKRVLSDTEKLLNGMNLMRIEFEKKFSPQAIKELRITKVLNQEIIEWVWKNAKEMTVHSFEAHPSTYRIPRKDERVRTFQFRVCLCALAYLVNWIIQGSPQDMNKEKLRNDIVDINFAAFASFFDGLLSSDKKLLNTYYSARSILDLKL